MLPQADGYKVWIDENDMRGSINNAMAKAVEGAKVVLLCVSEKYKESRNCKKGTSPFMIVYKLTDWLIGWFND